MKWEDIDSDLINAVQESSKAPRVIPHMPQEEEMKRIRRELEAAFAQEIPKAPLETSPEVSRALRVSQENQSVKPLKADPPQYTLSGSTESIDGLNINTEPKQFTLSGPKRTPLLTRKRAAGLVIGGALAAAAFGFPRSRHMIFQLIGLESGKVQRPLIPVSNSVEANRLRKRIDDLRIESGAFSGCYRLQATDNRVIWYFDNLGLIASCQTRPSWVRNYLERYLDHVDHGTGTIRDVDDISKRTFHTSDSDAAYTATMLSLAAKWQRTSDQRWTLEELTALKQITRKTIIEVQ